ncbi:DUF6477 family protein [Yoonia sp. 2307UL14-13]|uniref:DUF6477 family protein n=1 Tax=Yoonia sp. 2307UL14-13 TaxID=3126506 RepID=UPI0030B0F298
MLDIHSRLAQLKRPKLLVRATRFGVDHYRRETHLPRILFDDDLPRHAEAIVRLFEIEEDMNRARVARAGDYRVADHVEVLIAIAGEARLMQSLALM